MNEGYEFLSTAIQEALDTHAPKRTVTVRSDERFREAWLTVKIKKYNQKCRRLCSRAKDSGLLSDFQKYKNYRNVLNRIKLHEKRVHYSNLFEKIVSLLYKGKHLTKDSDISNAFNEHFVNAGRLVQDTIPPINNPDRCKYVRKVTNKLSFRRISESEICKVVSHMQPKTRMHSSRMRTARSRSHSGGLQ